MNGQWTTVAVSEFGMQQYEHVCGLKIFKMAGSVIVHRSDHTVGRQHAEAVEKDLILAGYQQIEGGATATTVVYVWQEDGPEPPLEWRERCPMLVQDREAQVAAAMREVGVPAHLQGYRYLLLAILMVTECADLTRSMTKHVYPAVARIENTTATRVERCMRHAIEAAWNRGAVDVLHSLFGNTIHPKRGRPTNSEFIALIADNIRRAAMSA